MNTSPVHFLVFRLVAFLWRTALEKLHKYGAIPLLLASSSNVASFPPTALFLPPFALISLRSQCQLYSVLPTLCLFARSTVTRLSVIHRVVTTKSFLFPLRARGPRYPRLPPTSASTGVGQRHPRLSLLRQLQRLQVAKARLCRGRRVPTKARRTRRISTTICSATAASFAAGNTA